MSVGIVQTKAISLTLCASERWLMDACRSLRSAQPSPKEEPPHSSEPQPMIPGLPDDVAYCCFLRAPLSSHHAMARVCRQWRAATRDQARGFYAERLRNGLADNWICALVRDRHNRNSLRAFDTRSGAWIRLPPMPDTAHGRAVGQECRAVGGRIVVCGGWRDRPLDDVTIYDPRSNTWVAGPPMLSPRAHFVSGVIGDRLYVAGGGNGRQPRTRSAEYYDPADNRWHAVESLDVCVSFCLGLAVGGKLFVQARGGVPRETQVYVPDFGVWSAIKSNMLAWPHRPHVAVGDNLYRADVNRGCHELMSYDPESDAWNSLGPIVNGPRRRIHEMVGVGGKLWAVADDLSVGAVEVNGKSAMFVGHGGGGAAGREERLVSCHVLVL